MACHLGPRLFGSSPRAWGTHPRNDYRCRCHAFALSQAGIEKLQKAGQKLNFTAPPPSTLPWVNPRTGEVANVPRGVAPGFAYNPGKLRDAQLHELVLRKAMASPAYSGAVVAAQAAADHPAMVAQATERFADWFDALQQRGKAVGEMQHLGVIPPPVLRELARRGAALQGAVVSVTDVDVLHALRDGKAAAVEAGLFRRLPELLQRATAVLREPQATPQVLLYVVDLVKADGAVAKLVVKLDQVVKVQKDGARGPVVLNAVRTATVMDPLALKDRTAYELLWGRL